MRHLLILFIFYLERQFKQVYKARFLSVIFYPLLTVLFAIGQIELPEPHFVKVILCNNLLQFSLSVIQGNLHVLIDFQQLLIFLYCIIQSTLQNLIIQFLFF